MDIDEQLALMLMITDEEPENLAETKFEPIVTRVYPGMINEDECNSMFRYLKENVNWGEGVKTRRGDHTRLACAYQYGHNKRLDDFLKKIQCTIPKGRYQLAGIYLNYQRNGEEYTPLHSHVGGFQQIICLGPARRKFVIDNKTHKLGNGDVAIFSTEKHGLPKDKNCNKERISIATFYMKVD
jgi:hypothetical protein